MQDIGTGSVNLTSHMIYQILVILQVSVLGYGAHWSP